MITIQSRLYSKQLQQMHGSEVNLCGCCPQTLRKEFHHEARQYYGRVLSCY